VSESFIISRSVYSASSADQLQQEIQAQTGNASATESILRSMERFGQDDSIRRYEINQQVRVRGRHGMAQGAWTVRAVRELDT
jgi:hypothetical protein